MENQLNKNNTENIDPQQQEKQYLKKQLHTQNRKFGTILNNHQTCQVEEETLPIKPVQNNYQKIEEIKVEQSQLDFAEQGNEKSHNQMQIEEYADALGQNQDLIENEIEDSNQTQQNDFNTNNSYQLITKPENENFQQQNLFQQLEKKVDYDYMFEEDKLNQDAVAVYSRQIFDYLREEEIKHLVCPNYFHLIQTDINEKMRAILIDWLIDVHFKFKLVQETLYLTVHLIDKYLEQNQVNRQKLQLVGVSALFMACKIEEIYAPELKDFVYVCDSAYTKDEILEQESRIIQQLDFNFTSTSSLRFLLRYAQLIKYNQQVVNLSLYLLELSLVEYQMLKYQPSNIAAASLYLSNKLLNPGQAWNNTLTLQSKYNDQSLKSCAKDMLILLQNSEKSTLSAVRRKYSQLQYGEISKIQIDFSGKQLVTSINNWTYVYQTANSNKQNFSVSQGENISNGADPQNIHQHNVSNQNQGENEDIENCTNNHKKHTKSNQSVSVQSSINDIEAQIKESQINNNNNNNNSNNNNSNVSQTEGKEKSSPMMNNFM